MLDQYQGLWPTPPVKPIDWYFALQDQTRRAMIELIIGEKDPEERFETSRSSCTLRWFLAHIVEHDSYTGGQAVLLHEMFKRIGAL